MSLWEMPLLLMLAFAFQLWMIGNAIVARQINFAGVKVLRLDKPKTYWLGFCFLFLFPVMTAVIFAEVHWNILR